MGCDVLDFHKPSFFAREGKGWLAVEGPVSAYPAGGKFHGRASCSPASWPHTVILRVRDKTRPSPERRG